MLTAELREMAARQLADFDSRTPNRLFSRSPGLSIVDAYELQHEVIRLREQRGEKTIGYKIGCTSQAIQQQLGIHEPIFGRIFDTGCFASGTRLSRSNYANLAIEGELAVRLAADLSDSPLEDEKYLEAIESIFPVIELHDYVLHSPRPCGQELIASNGMHVGFVLSDKPGTGARDRVQELSIRIKETIVDRTEDPWTMNGPIASLRWLAARVGQQGLSRGQVILTGSPMKLYPVAAGSRVLVEAPPLGKSCIEIDP